MHQPAHGHHPFAAPNELAGLPSGPAVDVLSGIASSLAQLDGLLRQIRELLEGGVNGAAVPPRFDLTHESGPAVIDHETGRVGLMLLGPFSIRLGGCAVEIQRRGKAEAVLKAIALQPSRRVAARVLSEWVWPDVDEAEGRHSLQSTVSAMRRSLLRFGRPVEVVHFHNDAYELDANVVTDIELFDHAYAQVLDFERAGAAERALETLIGAIPLYRDDVDIDEFGDLGFLVERERLIALNLQMLSKISGYYYRLERWEESLGFANQLIRRDPSREDAHRLIMRCYLRMGQRSQALRQYDVCARIVREHLDAEVEPETASLHHDIVLSQR